MKACEFLHEKDEFLALRFEVGAQAGHQFLDPVTRETQGSRYGPIKIAVDDPDRERKVYRGVEFDEIDGISRKA